MQNKLNVTGLWRYKEDFEYGNSVGEVRLVQIEDTLYGEFNFTEKVGNDYEIDSIIDSYDMVNRKHNVQQELTRKVEFHPEAVLIDIKEINAIDNNANEVNYLIATDEAQKVYNNLYKEISTLRNIASKLDKALVKVREEMLNEEEEKK